MYVTVFEKTQTRNILAQSYQGRCISFLDSGLFFVKNVPYQNTTDFTCYLNYIIAKKNFTIFQVLRHPLSALNWHDCSQVRLTQLFSGDTGTIVPRWQWHDCSQVTLARLFPSEAGTIVPKWHWHKCSQVSLARLFPSETNANILKWN